MKKMVLILILVVPVLIALVIVTLAGFVAREADIPSPARVYINQYNEERMKNQFGPGSRIAIGFDFHFDHIYTIGGLQVGDSIFIREFITVAPRRARFSAFNPVYAAVTGGDDDEVEINEYNSPVVLTPEGYLVARFFDYRTITITLNARETSLTFTILGVGSPGAV